MKYLLFIIFLGSAATAVAQNKERDSVYMRQHYDKVEYFVPMRDGTKLYTLLYIPKDTRKQYPILLNRTCYNASAYGNFKTYSHPSRYLVRDGYILAFQDVRGRFQSGGKFDNMTPNIPGNDPKNKQAIDESSDTWDTIDWLIKNIKGHNGKVGMYGISYPVYGSRPSRCSSCPEGIFATGANC
jgi:uncharacterized protein